MKKFVTAIILLAVAGCAQQQWVWHKDGATPQNLNQDSYACERDARQSGYFGTGLVGQLNMQDFFDHCMSAQGWSKQMVNARNRADGEAVVKKNVEICKAQYKYGSKGFNACFDKLN